jgi:hypothetical protein
MSIHDQCDVASVRVDPGRRLVSVADKPAVNQGRLTAMQQEQVGVGKRPALPDNPGREPPGVGATHHGAGRPLSCCQ